MPKDSDRVKDHMLVIRLLFFPRSVALASCKLSC